jgi:hypothetical protein
MVGAVVTPDCELELDWPPVDVDEVALLAAKATPTEDNAASTEMARIEYARIFLLPSKPSLKLVCFHLPKSASRARVISNLQERPKIANGFSPND